jgi:hypothetical protein
MAKIIRSEGPSSNVITFGFESGRWAGIRSHIPEALTAEADVRLREAIIINCCLWLRHERERFEEGKANAAAMRSAGTGQPAPLRRYANALRAAADARREVRGIHDDHLDVGLHGSLDTMARDAERRLAALSKLGKPVRTDDPWFGFVRRVAQCCRDVGLRPTAPGGVYGDAKPSWFQEYMLALNNDWLGRDGRPIHSHPAFYAGIAKAMRGDRNTG